MGKKKISIILSALLFASSMTCISCSKGMDEKTQLEIKRLQARDEIQNLMGRYAFYHTSGLNFIAAQKLFTTYDDTVIEMVWGRYTGKDAAYRAYTVGHRLYDQPTISALKLNIPDLTPEEQAMVVGNSGADAVSAALAQSGSPSAAQGAAVAVTAPDGNASATADSVVLTGQTVANPDTVQPPEATTKNGGATLHIHTLTTPVIEVAGDGETARAVWFCPGLEGLTPAWMKYGCDFKKQDGEWKIWHLHVYGITMGLTARDSYTPVTTASNGANKPPTTSWEYSNAAKYIPYEPEPPQPYDTWDYATIQPKSYGDPN
jgi:hypothetical protein